MSVNNNNNNNTEASIVQKAMFWEGVPSELMGDKPAMINYYNAELAQLALDEEEGDIDEEELELAAWPIKIALYILGEKFNSSDERLINVFIESGLTHERLAVLEYNEELIEAVDELGLNDVLACKLKKHLDFIKEFSELRNDDKEVVAVLVRDDRDFMGHSDPSKILSGFVGCYNSPQDYVDEYLSEYDIPSFVTIDYQSTFDELTCDMYVIAEGGNYYLYSL